MHYALLVCGTVMFIYGLHGLWGSRAFTIVCNAVSGATSGLGIAFWPIENARQLDRIVHSTGVGLAVADTSAAVAILAQFTILTTLSEAWSRWRKAALGLAGTAIALFLPAWHSARDAAGHDAVRLLYGEYGGRPAAILVWNLLFGLTIVYVDVLAFRACRSLPPVVLDPRARSVRQALALLYAVGAVYGLLGAIQALLSWQGVSAIDLFPVSRVVFVGGGVGAAVVTIITAAPASWRWLNPGRKGRELWQIQADLIALSTLISDWLVFLRVYLDPDLVSGFAQRCQELAAAGNAQVRPVSGPGFVLRRRVLQRTIHAARQARTGLIALSVVVCDCLVALHRFGEADIVRATVERCEKHGLPKDQCRIAAQATRLIEFNRAVRIDEPWPDVGIEFAHAIDRAIARDALRRASEGVAFYTEVYRIMALALAPELVSPSPRRGRDPQRWQYVVATQIAQVLRLRAGAAPSPAS